MYNLSRWLLILYAILIFYGIVAFPLGWPAPWWLLSMSTVTFFIFAFCHSWVNLGLPATLLLLGLTFGISLTMESIGVLTGWIYGPYHYTDRLGAKFLGLVPYLIPMAWYMVVYSAHQITTALTRRYPRWLASPARFALTAAAILTAWDLVMDPMMVRMKMWVWEREGLYFGIPLQNYAGWLLTGFLVYLSFQWLERRLRLLEEPVTWEKPGLWQSFHWLPVWAYVIVGLGNGLATVEMGLVAPAVIGVVAMAIPVLLALTSPSAHKMTG